ncbi:MAG: ABC transporter ATP-binding protein [Armatimonadota bacterium]|nr:ABC transporter ATP-binding protein [bacterium]
MDKPILEIENLGKRYRIGANKEKYLSLRDEMSKWFSSTIRRKRAAQSEFWALSNVSFPVYQGESVGIIGKNGAGKSTLLKLLSKITPPTTGRIVRRGRVASLLEVGTGFHPELTGRENIYLNGAILGMSRKEIARKFDEIVAFSEVEKFLDTPVKRYSSGMYVRLAFAVAAHLEPEILVVDEVLAVGDVEFQRKCLGKMSDVATAGRTVLFVSHNMSAVSQLCTRGIFLENGAVACDGTVEEALTKYTCGQRNDAGELVLDTDSSKGIATLSRLYLTNKDGNIVDSFFVDEEMTLNFEIKFFKPIDEFQVSFLIQSSLGTGIYHCISRDQSGCCMLANSNNVRVSAIFLRNKLYPGRYTVNGIWIADKRGEMLYYSEGQGVSFDVPDTSPYVYRRLWNDRAIVHEVPIWDSSSI